ncbi:MAG TPA: BTAD domain-containing putative transcriptional regulator [Blastocatellia bacterium]|nr:BTAD domain-containing putative transcriptional regulator [Blastocatellia bacterium]
MSEAEREAIAAPPSLELHLLGAFRAAVDGRAVEERRWSRRKQSLLVKLLALQPHHRLHREQIMELLWPDLDAEAAANSLNKTIHAARRALEPALKYGPDSRFILTHGQQVHLRAPGELWIDAEVFEERAALALKTADAGGYEEALALYEDDLLIEDPYEGWIAARREHLRALRLELLAKLARLYEDVGEHQRSIERLKEMVTLEPSNEEAHRRLMRLYVLTGNRKQAIHQYQQCREDLRRELDARPEPATLALYEQVTAGAIRAPAVGEPEPTSEEDRAIDSIAILPLVNAGGDLNVEYLSDGITEGIIRSLSRLPALRVMAWSTVSRYKGKEFDPLEVGRGLRVRAVLTGRVLQLNDRLVIRAELVAAGDGSHLWGEQYDLEAADTFAAEGEISNDISRKLRLRLTGEDRRRLARRYTESTEAYLAYLKGRYYWNKRDTAQLKKGVEHFRQAIDLDPGYASAYAGLSDSYTLLVVRESVSPEDGFAKAKAAAARALEIDEGFAEAHASLGHAMLHNWEWGAAERELKRAIELNPGYPSAHHWYSEHLTAMGRCQESIMELKLAGELDPLSLIISADLGRAFYYARLYDQVMRQEARTLEMDASFWLSHINLGRSYTQEGRHAEAVEELRKASKLSAGNTEVLSFLGFAYAAAGERAAALKALGELVERSRRSHVPPYHFAILQAGLGEKDQALAWLERAFEKHSVDLFTLKVEPMFDGLRSDPRFQDLVRRLDLD